MVKSTHFEHIDNCLEALHPNATDVDKIYDDDYSDEQLSAGRSKIKIKKLLDRLAGRGDRGEHECRFLNFYVKLFTWPQLGKLLCNNNFVELVQVYLIPTSHGHYLPSELVIFRYKTVLLVVTKLWCSAANSYGVISKE